MASHARAAKAGHHFIRDQQRPMTACDVRGLPQPPAWLRNHSRRALHERFKHKCRVGIALFLLRRKFLFHQPHAFPGTFPVLARILPFRLRAIERTTIAIRRHHLVRGEQHPAIRLVKQIHMTERHRADGVAVVRAIQGKKPGLGFFAARPAGKFIRQL